MAQTEEVADEKKPQAQTKSERAVLDSQAGMGIGCTRQMSILPLSRFMSQESWPETIRWQNTSREGRLVLAQLNTFLW